MVFSVITAIPLILHYVSIHYSQHYPEIENITFESEPMCWEYIVMYPFFTAPAAFPLQEDSHTTILFLFGMIQSAFLVNLFDFLHLSYGWGAGYARIMSTIFFVYGLVRCMGFLTILIPKFPLKIHWKSIICINLFFLITGYYAFPYTTNSLLYQHFYVYLLCIEASIWYYTEEFHLFTRYPRHDYFLFNKVYKFTIHRNKPKKVGKLYASVDICDK